MQSFRSIFRSDSFTCLRYCAVAHRDIRRSWQTSDPESGRRGNIAADIAHGFQIEQFVASRGVEFFQNQQSRAMSFRQLTHSAIELRQDAREIGAGQDAQMILGAGRGQAAEEDVESHVTREELSNGGSDAASGRAGRFQGVDLEEAKTRTRDTRAAGIAHDRVPGAALIAHRRFE